VDFWTLLGLIATLTFIVLVGIYVSELHHNSTWDLRKPMSLGELFREWIIFVVLFGGLSALLHGALLLACWTVC
jgi:hypothetical protein